MSDFVKALLDISIYHLTEDTRARMAADSINYRAQQPRSLPFTVKGSSFGWFIDVRNAAERHCATVPYPSDIVECYELALALHCEYLLFDRDAERHRALPWYGAVDQDIYDEPPPQIISPRKLLLNDFAVSRAELDL